MSKKIPGYLIILLLFSCISHETSRPKEVHLTSPATVYSYDGISLSLTPLTKAELEMIHGSDSHIFANHPGVYPPKKVYAIYCELRADHNISLQYSDISLINAYGKAYPAVSRYDLYELWENKLPASRKEGYARLIDNTLLPEKIILTQNREAARGYMVFILREETNGLFHLAIPPSPEIGNPEPLMLPIKLQ